MRNPLLYFCYACPSGFSGQKAATELVISGLTARGWDCKRLKQPVLERDGTWCAVFIYLLELLKAWGRTLVLATAPDAWLCVNLGQTPASFVRDLPALLLGRWFLGRRRVLISLHGSVFLSWPRSSRKGRAFRFLLSQAGLVTVLGERQRQHLVSLGCEPARVRILVNSCLVPPLSDAALEGKISGITLTSRPLRVLHLSSLIASKGFPAYLEALEQLSSETGPRLEAVLCGKYVASEFQDRFADVGEAEQWIRGKIQAIQEGKSVSIDWIQGASGEPKQRLFAWADIFVFPSEYAVEAQPLVLLEAMASGCAVVTTPIGEIPTILSSEEAVFLESGSREAVERALRSLSGGRARVASLASAARDRFSREFSIERHLDHWEALLNDGGRRL